MHATRRRLSRHTLQTGASILSLLVLVGILGATGLALQSSLPSNNITQTAAADTPYDSSAFNENCTRAFQELDPQHAPVSCCAAKNRASDLKKDADYETSQTIRVTDAKGTLNECFGAVINPESPTYQTLLAQKKDPKTDPNSYKCVGRSGRTWYSESAGYLHSYTTPDSTVAPGKCKLQICDSKGEHCKPAQLYEGGASVPSFMLTEIPITEPPPAPAPTEITPGDGDGSPNPWDLVGENCPGEMMRVGGCPPEDAAPPVAEPKANIDLTPQQIQALCNYAPGACGSETQGLPAEKVQDICKVNPKLCTSFGITVPPPPGQSQCTGSNCPPPPAPNPARVSGGNNTFPGNQPPGNQPRQQSGGFNLSSIMPLLNGLLKGFLGNGGNSSTAPKPVACSADPNVYAQQQQQYQQALQEYNFELQQYNYQVQLILQRGGDPGSLQKPERPVPCTPSTQGQCPKQADQPLPESCSVGIWQPVKQGTCVVGWQCVPTVPPTPTSTPPAVPEASITCDPDLADVGSTVTIRYSCSVGTASSDDFTASGSAGEDTVDITSSSKDSTSYNLTCTNQGKTAGAQCTVQINKASITLVANPKTVESGSTSLIGWVTTGMRSCTITSPTQPAFTARNSANTSTSGTAETDAVTGAAEFDLDCETYGGAKKNASIYVTVDNTPVASAQ